MGTTIPIVPTPANMQMYAGTVIAVIREELFRSVNFEDPNDLVGGTLLSIAMYGGTVEDMRVSIRASKEWHEKHDRPPKPSFAPWKSAFCIPDALPGIPFGDGKRIWTPAFACYAGTPWQDRMLDELVKRHYNALEYQVSGFAYRGDYPEIPLDVTRTVADLTKIRARGLRTMIAFRDDVGDDLSYLEPIAAATQDLVDDVMGIYEVNGVLQDPDRVLKVLVQARKLWPKAILGVHFTDLVEGESHGLVDWHKAVDQAQLNVLFFQASGWVYGPERVAIRLADFTRRLGGPQFHGYPTLSHGVMVFELTTSKTYREAMTEADGVAFTDAVLAVPMAPDAGVLSVPATGFMDGGSA